MPRAKSALSRTIVLSLVLLFLSAPPANAGEPWWYRACQIAHAGAQGADGYTTGLARGSGKGVETNPFLGHFNNPIVFGTVKAGMAASSIIIVDEVAKSKKAKVWGAILNCGLASTFYKISYNNYKVYQK